MKMYEIAHVALMLSEEWLIRWDTVRLEFSNGLGNKFNGFCAKIHLTFRKCIVTDIVETREKFCVIECGFSHWIVVPEGHGIAVNGIARLGSGTILGLGVSSILNGGRRSLVAMCLGFICQGCEMDRVWSMQHTIMAMMLRQDIMRDFWVQAVMRCGICWECIVMALLPWPWDMIIKDFLAAFCCTVSRGLVECLDNICVRKACCTGTCLDVTTVIKNLKYV